MKAERDALHKSGNTGCVTMRHPIHKNIRMIGGRKVAVWGEHCMLSTGQRATFGLTPTLSR
jgi:hypothetical protein